MSATSERGRYFESLACQFLQQQGLQLLTQNFRCRLGEIDLIFRQGEQLIFVEVKYRQHDYFGGAAAAVTYQKQQKLTRTAHFYLQQQRSQAACRFDVIAISGDEPYTIEWIKNAF